MRILLGMSGGLDSTYAALKLKEEGHSVEGAVLIMHEYTEIESAREAARDVGIVLHEIDCKKLFEEKVVSNFISEYTKGRTPNPCIVCNREVKFKSLLDYAKANGFDKIATGHYARIENVGNDGKAVISRSSDEKKDQTYMLWRLSREVIENLVFPLGDTTKEEIRALPEGARILTLEQGMRFLTDHLQGDTYFRIHHEGHNLERTRTQLKLVADMEEKRPLLQAIVDQYL